MAAAHSSPNTEPSRTNVVATFLAVVGCFLIFGLIVYLAYLPKRAASVTPDLAKVDEADRWRYTDDGRDSHLSKFRTNEQAAATSYAVLDEKNGVYRLPIDRAIELYVQEAAAAKR